MMFLLCGLSQNITLTCMKSRTLPEIQDSSVRRGGDIFRYPSVAMPPEERHQKSHFI